MRSNSTITAGVVASALSPVRTINCRVWIRDDRMVFTELPQGYSGDAPIGDGYESHAMALSGDRIYRVVAKVVNDEWRIYTQRLSDPNLNPWPDWVQRANLLMPYTAPGIYGLYESYVRKALIWGRNASGFVSTYKVDSNSWDEAATTLNFTSDYRLSFAPLSETECYILATDQRANTSASFLHYVQIDANREVITHSEWQGVLHAQEADWKSLSAVRFGGLDYCYFSSDHGKRSLCITAAAGAAFSNPQDIFPLDYSDDIVKLEIGSAKTTLDRVWICGILTRSASAQPMQVYTLGPDHFTAGRDMFIGDFATTEVTRNINGTDYTFPARPGSIIAHGSHIWLILPGTVARAQIPRWLSQYGAGPSWYYSCNKVSAQFDKSGNASLTVEVPLDIDPAIRPGMTLVLQPYVDSPGETGGWFDLGMYEIDAITEPRTPFGKTKTIVARPKGIKRLSQWRSDASYDYWSQEARVSELYDQSYNVRIANFKTDESSQLVPRDLDKNCLLYNAGRTSTGYAVRAKFSIASGRFTYVGPMVSVHAETRIDTAYRLGIDPEAVSSAAVRTSGILFLYHDSQGDPGWRLYHLKSDQDWSANGISNCPWSLLDGQADQTLADGEYEMMAVYNHGRVDVYYRSTSESSWSRPLSTFRFEHEEEGDFVLPYSRTDGRARVGFFARSELDYTNRTKILRHGYSYDSLASVFLEDPAAIEEADELEEPYAYSNTLITKILSLGANFGASIVSPPSPIRPGNAAGNILYADVLPWQGVWYPSDGQPWDNTEKADIQAEDPEAGDNGGHWIWLTLYSVDPAYTGGGYPSLDNQYSGLDRNSLKGAVIEFYNSAWYDGCASVINMVDWCPPARWQPLWPYNPYGTPWTLSYFNSTGYQWWWYPNNSSWGYWENGQDYFVGVHERVIGGATIRTPENIWGISPLTIRVLGHHVYFDYLNRMTLPYGIHFRPGGLNTNQTKARIYLPNRIQAAPFYGMYAAAYWAHAQRTPALMNRYVRTVTTDTPVGKEIVVGSAEPDRTFSWMAVEICRKAGVLNVSVEQELTTFTKAGLNWDFNPEQQGFRLRPRAGILRFKQSTSDTGVFAVQSGGAVLGGEFWNGTIITCSVDYARKWLVSEGVVTLEESIPLSPGQGAQGAWVTVSFNDDHASVWVNDAIVAVFKVETTINALMPTSQQNVTTEVDWPVLDMRVDNFVLDMNQIGIDLLRRLIKRKRVHFCDDSQGGIKIFKDGEAINTEETPYAMTLSSSKSVTDTPRITRVRLEGIDVHEAMDEESLLQYGNVFIVENFDELEIHEQFVQEGAEYLEDVDRATRPRSYVGPADPRVEPWDRLWISDGTDTVEVMVSSVTFNLLISEDEATFDMSLEAEEI